MTLTDRALFLSLKPPYADLILDGDKTVELRRIRPRAAAGTLAIVYASSPVQAVLGTCVLDQIRCGTPDAIWKLHGPHTGIRRTDFRRYFDGADVAVAITVSDPRRLDEPVPLHDLRAVFSGFAPPQSFRYVTPGMAKALAQERWLEHSSLPV